MTSPSSSSPFKTTLEDFKPKNNGGKSEEKPKESLRQPEISKPEVTQPVVPAKPSVSSPISKHDNNYYGGSTGSSSTIDTEKWLAPQTPPKTKPVVKKPQDNGGKPVDCGLNCPPTPPRLKFDDAYGLPSNQPSNKNQSNETHKKSDKESKSSGNPFDDKDLSKWRQPDPKVEPKKPTNHHNDAYGISYPKEREDLSKWLHKPNSDKEKEKKTDSPKPDNKKPETPPSKPNPPRNAYSDAYGLTYGGLSNIGVRPDLKPKPKPDNKANDQGGWKKPDNCDPFATPGHPRSCYPPNNNKPKKRGRRALPDNNDAYGINYNGLNGIGNIPTLAPKKENKRQKVLLINH